MPAAEKQALISNSAGHMKGIPERIAKLQIEHFTKAYPAYGPGRCGRPRDGCTGACVREVTNIAREGGLVCLAATDPRRSTE
jgi:hypothetical protein